MRLVHDHTCYCNSLFLEEVSCVDYQDVPRRVIHHNKNVSQMVKKSLNSCGYYKHWFSV